MTYQDYFRQADFEEIWHYLQSNFNEDKKLKPLYRDLIKAVKELPVKDEYSNEKINFFWNSGLHVGGVPDSQEWLVGREVKRNFPRRIGVKNKLDDPAEMAAFLIYWSTLYSFKTQGQKFKEFEKWLDDMGNDKPHLIKFEERAVTESFKRKRELYWKSIIDGDSAISWNANLRILRKKLQYNIGYWRFVQRYVGWEEDVKRMQTACKLLEIAGSDYPNIDGIHINTRNAFRYTKATDWNASDKDCHEHYLKELYRDKAYHILWKFLDHNMKNWWD